MPGAVVAAAPTTVFPVTLSTAFVRMFEYEAITNLYSDGSSQASALCDSPRGMWQMSKRLKATDLQTLLSWFDTYGQHGCFWFYDPYESIPLFSYDPTGAATGGRYTVRFNTNISYSLDLGRGNVQCELIEIL